MPQVFLSLCMRNFPISSGYFSRETLWASLKKLTTFLGVLVHMEQRSKEAVRKNVFSAVYDANFFLTSVVPFNFCLWVFEGESRNWVWYYATHLECLTFVEATDTVWRTTSTHALTYMSWNEWKSEFGGTLLCKIWLPQPGIEECTRLSVACCVASVYVRKFWAVRFFMPQPNFLKLPSAIISSILPGLGYPVKKSNFQYFGRFKKLYCLGGSVCDVHNQ